ncbi:MAG: DUF3431 domain-containing protein [Verrucomicrobiota bacterium]
MTNSTRKTPTGLEKNRTHLVVSHYSEDLGWLNNVPEDIHVFLYSKAEQPPDGSVRLPNLGREAHTYLHHIVSRYDSLAEVTVFCQGHPFDHCHHFHEILRALSKEMPSEPFKWHGFIIDTDDCRGRRLHVPWSKNPDGKELDIGHCHQALFGRGGPEWYRFVVGAQFSTHRSQILKRPKSFYEKALEYTADVADASFSLERMWDRVFGVHYVTDELLPKGQMTRYLKKVKKLESQKS